MGDGHDGLGGEQNAPDEKVGPVYGTAIRGVVHVSVAETPSAGIQEVTGVGEPDVGVVFEEKSGFGDALDGVGRNGAGGEGAGGAVGVKGYKDDEEGKSEENDRGEEGRAGSRGGRELGGDGHDGDR